MRLITHNLLRCNIRGLTAEQGYPLKIEAVKTEVVPAQFSVGMFAHVFSHQLSWKIRSYDIFLQSLSEPC